MAKNCGGSYNVERIQQHKNDWESNYLVQLSGVVLGVGPQMAS